MSVNADNTPIMELALVGAMIALGKLLAGRKKMTLRRCAGRVIIGAALSMVAGAMLAMIPDILITALIGLGSTLGVCGQSILEAACMFRITSANSTLGSLRAEF